MRPEVRRGRTRGFVMGVIGMIPEVTLLPMVCIKPWAGGLLGSGMRLIDVMGYSGYSG